MTELLSDYLPIVIFLGLCAVIGLALIAGLLNWFGKLPGDLRLEGDNVGVHAPIASMLLISLVLSVALAVIGRLR